MNNLLGIAMYIEVTISAWTINGRYTRYMTFCLPMNGGTVNYKTIPKHGVQHLFCLHLAGENLQNCPSHR